MAHADVDRKPLCQGRARNDRQPRASENQCNDGGMHPLNCAAISWALDVSVSSASASRLLIEIARRSEGGRCAATQKALGEACKLSERQTRTLIASLIADGAIKRTRQGGTGAGRAADVYDLQGYSEAKQPAISAASQATGNERHLGATGEDCRLTVPDGGQPAISDRKKLPVGATGNGTPIPPIDITPISQKEVVLNSEREESSLERGLGSGLFGEAALSDVAPPATPTSAKPKRRPRRAKFYATDEAMPAEPNPEMLAYAAEKGMRNGTLAEQHGKFRRWHIRERTLIACLEQRWETWADNWARSNPVRPEGGAPPGYRLGGIGPDGKQRYLKIQTNNVYR